MSWIAGSERCRSIDRQATQAFGIRSETLMESAGQAVMRTVCQMVGEGGRVTVVCGKGNNGGDGLVVARMAKQAGYQVECLVAGSPEELSQEAQVQLQKAKDAGISPIFPSDAGFHDKLECVGCRDLIVDALLGTGAKGEVRGLIREAIQAINVSGTPVVSVDIPSGIDCDTGDELGDSVWATRTVTLGLPKPFLFQGIGMEHSGHWVVDPIGFPQALLDQHTDALFLDDQWVGSQIPERMKSSHKGDNGKLLVVAGSARFPGAAALVARSAMRAGAGLVTVASIPSVCHAIACQMPEITFLPLPEKDGAIAPEAAQVLAAHHNLGDAAVFGPGLTTGEGVGKFLDSFWMGWRRPCIIDADALNLVASGACHLPDCDAVLTPHPGEMGRLMKASTAEVQGDRFGTARKAAEHFGKAVLLKGPYTVAAETGEPLLVNATGNPGMACAGMGDVLSGLIGTLLAQSFPPLTAGALAMYLHGEAGDLCASEIGTVGFAASDLANALPQARATILSRCGLD